MKITDGVYWVGVNDTQTKLFEALWSLSRGVSYNSYLILGSEKKALIDTVNKDFSEEYIRGLRRLIDPEDLDYIVLNHVEPDHAGSLSKILSVASKASVVGMANGIEFVRKYHRVPFNDIVVKDGVTIDLGGKTLRFIETPCIHWPETMCTYLAEDGIMFSGDLFGSFGAIGDQIFDDRFDEVFKNEAKRYFAAVLSPYAAFVNRAIKKFDTLDTPIRVIAPSHGLIYKENPSEIKNLYAELSSGKFEEKVVIVYGSMYGNTETLAEAVAKGVRDRGVRGVIFNISYSEPGDVLSEIWRAPAVAVGSPVYDSFIFPPITNLLELIKLKRIKQRVFGLFGNYTWGGGPFKQLERSIQGLGSEIVGTFVEAQGSPIPSNIQEAEELGNILADAAIQRVKETSGSAP
ncbi:MAG: FprA family A-type flavoprotein [Nitrososphaerales archaeon]